MNNTELNSQEGEHTTSHHSATGAKSSNGRSAKIAGAVIFGAVIVSSLSFVSGINYQKHQTNNIQRPGQMSADGFGPQGGMGQRRMGDIGEVTAVTDSSISISNPQSGTTDTVTVSSDTTITNDGQAVTLSSIKVGDTVAITKSTSDTKAASRIIVNPSFGGPRAGQSSDTSTDTQTN